MLKTKEDQVPQRIESLFTEMKSIQKENESLSARLANAEAADLIEQTENIEGVPLLAAKVNVKDMNALRQMVDEFKQQLTSGIILLAIENGEKVQLAGSVSEDLVKKGYHAGNMVKQAASICGGGGGGRPDMAQAGGKNPEKINEALESAKDYIKNVSS